MEWYERANPRSEGGCSLKQGPWENPPLPPEGFPSRDTVDMAALHRRNPELYSDPAVRLPQYQQGGRVPKGGPFGNPPLQEWDTPGAMHSIAQGHPSYRFMEDAARQSLDEATQKYEGRPLTEQDLDRGRQIFEDTRQLQRERGDFKPEKYPAMQHGGRVEHEFPGTNEEVGPQGEGNDEREPPAEGTDMYHDMQEEPSDEEMRQFNERNPGDRSQEIYDAQQMQRRYEQFNREYDKKHSPVPNYRQGGKVENDKISAQLDDPEHGSWHDDGKFQIYTPHPSFFDEVNPHHLVDYFEQHAPEDHRLHLP
jgi:hypothetical protein